MSWIFFFEIPSGQWIIYYKCNYSEMRIMLSDLGDLKFKTASTPLFMLSPQIVSLGSQLFKGKLRFSANKLLLAIHDKLPNIIFVCRRWVCRISQFRNHDHPLFHVRPFITSCRCCSRKLWTLILRNAGWIISWIWFWVTFDLKSEHQAEVLRFSLELANGFSEACLKHPKRQQ